jgi:hypothetical protein
MSVGERPDLFVKQCDDGGHRAEICGIIRVVQNRDRGRYRIQYVIKGNIKRLIALHRSHPFELEHL